VGIPPFPCSTAITQAVCGPLLLCFFFFLRSFRLRACPSLTYVRSPSLALPLVGSHKLTIIFFAGTTKVRLLPVLRSPPFSFLCSWSSVPQYFANEVLNHKIRPYWVIPLTPTLSPSFSHKRFSEFSFRSNAVSFACSGKQAPVSALETSLLVQC